MAKRKRAKLENMDGTTPVRQPENTIITANKDGQIVISQETVDAYSGIHRSLSRDTFQNYDTNTSVRDQYTRSDYEYFRPNESIPQKDLEILAACRSAYKKVGIVRNIMDLMSDFGSQGARLVHPNPSIQKFCRGWWKKVRGGDVSERFLNLLYREAIAVINRTMGKLPKLNERKMRAMGKLGPDVTIDKPLTTQKRNIPILYNFLNPLNLVPVGGDLANFVGKQAYSLKVSYKLRDTILNPKTEQEKELVGLIPQEIKKMISDGALAIPLDPDKVNAFHYKKDSWETFATPMTYAVMDDLILLGKMKLSDLSALDGAISQVRLWKLGDIEQGIFPEPAAIQRLADILQSNPGGGAFDIIWGPELSFEESNTNVHQFLGKEKYEPVWNSIYAGYGVPPTLTGSSGSAGMTNNYISLKTLVQRLEYGRSKLQEFWETELELLREAMGFKVAPKLVFDQMVLSDEAAEKALLVQLADRDILSVETITERFGEIPEVEELKLRREEKARKSGKVKPKASPWHSPEKMHEYIKLALQRGYIAPEQTGMNDVIPDEFLDIETPFEQQMNIKNEGTGQTKQDKPSGEPSPGRPKNAKDKEKRKQREPKPLGASTASFLTAMLWAKEMQKTISDIVNPIYLKMKNKKNLRALSGNESTELDNIKFNILCNTDVYTVIDEKHIRAKFSNYKKTPEKYTKLYNSLYEESLKKNGSITLEENHTIQASTYSLLNCEEERIYENA